jgi:hypothetical protein
MYQNNNPKIKMENFEAGLSRENQLKRVACMTKPLHRIDYL